MFRNRQSQHLKQLCLPSQHHERVSIKPSSRRRCEIVTRNTPKPQETLAVIPVKVTQQPETKWLQMLWRLPIRGLWDGPRNFMFQVTTPVGDVPGTGASSALQRQLEEFRQECHATRDTLLCRNNHFCVLRSPFCSEPQCRVLHVSVCAMSPLKPSKLPPVLMMTPVQTSSTVLSASFPAAVFVPMS